MTHMSIVSPDARWGLFNPLYALRYEHNGYIYPRAHKERAYEDNCFHRGSTTIGFDIWGYAICEANSRKSQLCASGVV